MAKDRLHFKCTAKQGGVSLKKIMNELSDEGRKVLLKVFGKIANEEFVYVRPAFDWSDEIEEWGDLATGAITQEAAESLENLESADRAYQRMHQIIGAELHGVFVQISCTENEYWDELKNGLSEIRGLSLSIDDKKTGKFADIGVIGDISAPGNNSWYVRYVGVGIQPNGKVGPLDLYGKSFEEYLAEFDSLHNQWYGCPDTD